MEPVRLKISLFALIGLVVLILNVSKASNELDFFDKSKFDRSFIEQSDSGDFQIRMIGKKFASVYTSEGRPVAVFDLSMSHLSLGKILLGAFKVKDLNWKGVKNHRKCQRRAIKANRKFEKGKSVRKVNLEDCHVRGGPEGEIDFWSHMRMNEEWAIRNNRLDKGDFIAGYEFQHSSFNLSELFISNSETEEAILKPFLKLGKTLYPQKEWTKDEVKNFMAEFEMEFNQKDQSYNLVWNTSKRKKDKKPKLPGFVVNYVQPAANVIYRNRLLQISQLGDLTRFRWWPYGSLVSMFIYRISDKLIDRLNYHESQFIGLLESAQRFEYDMKMPAILTELSLDLAYLSKSRPENYRSGADLRKKRRAYQDEAREKVYKKLIKRSQKENISVELTGNDKWFVTRDKKGTFSGIFHAGVKPNLITRQISKAVNVKTSVFKSTERFLTDVTGLLAKTYLRTFFRVPIPYVNFVIQIPRDTWDRLVRQRMWKEVNLEGELVGLLDEGIAGRLSLGLSTEEMKLARKRLAEIYMNPYESHIEKEDEIIEKNLALLKKVIADNKDVLMDEKYLVPFSL